jgi:hypothetical protein
MIPLRASLDSALLVGSIIDMVQVESLEVLEKASVAPAQARAIVRAIEIEISGARDTLATKHDVTQLESRLRAEIGELASRLRVEMGEIESRLRAEIAKIGGDLHAEIHRAVSGSTRQMYMALLGHMAMTLGFVYFLVTQLR